MEHCLLHRDKMDTSTFTTLPLLKRYVVLTTKVRRRGSKRRRESKKKKRREKKSTSKFSYLYFSNLFVVQLINYYAGDESNRLSVWVQKIVWITDEMVFLASSFFILVFYFTDFVFLCIYLLYSSRLFFLIF